MSDTSSLTYVPISDSIRRALIRYFPSYMQVIGEYVPLLINSGALPAFFTAPELIKALAHIGVKVTRSNTFYNLKNPFNPIVEPLSGNTLVALTTKIDPSKWDHVYCMRPRYQIMEMIEEVAYYREFEWGHRNAVAPIDIFDGVLDDEGMEFLSGVYDQISVRAHKTPYVWKGRYRHFTDFSDLTTTPLDQGVIVKPAEYKVAFFDAVVTEGIFSTWELTAKTGIHSANLGHILRKSGHIRDSRRIIVHANSIPEALEKANEPGYAISLDENTYLVQLRSRLRVKTAEEMLKMGENSQESVKNGTKPVFSPLSRTNALQIRKNHAFPGFQATFLQKMLRRVAKRGINIEIPLDLSRVEDILSYMKDKAENSPEIPQIDESNDERGAA